MSIGSDVSMIEVKDENNFKRVSGTCVGGGTLLCLAKYILKVQSYEELLELSQ